METDFQYLFWVNFSEQSMLFNEIWKQVRLKWICLRMEIGVSCCLLPSNAVCMPLCLPCLWGTGPLLGSCPFNPNVSLFLWQTGYPYRPPLTLCGLLWCTSDRSSSCISCDVQFVATLMKWSALWWCIPSHPSWLTCQWWTLGPGPGRWLGSDDDDRSSSPT